MNMIHAPPLAVFLPKLGDFFFSWLTFSARQDFPAELKVFLLWLKKRWWGVVLRKFSYASPRNTSFFGLNLSVAHLHAPFVPPCAAESPAKPPPAPAILMEEAASLEAAFGEAHRCSSALPGCARRALDLHTLARVGL